MKLIIALRILPVIQIALYVVSMLIIYSSSHDGVDSFAGLNALLPLASFVLVGIVTIILWIIYIVKLRHKKSNIDKVALILVIVVICLAALYAPIVRWALDGPG